MYTWSSANLAKIALLEPRFQKVLMHYITIARHDSTIVEGLRSDEQCYINFGKGRTAAQCTAGGCPMKYAQPKLAKVTWVGHALSSNHRKKADGFGWAVDMYPYPVSLVLGRPDNEWMPIFKEMNEDMQRAAKEVGVTIRYGADWDSDGVLHERGETDNPHWELVG